MHETPACGASASEHRSAGELIDTERTLPSISLQELSTAIAVSDGRATRGYIIETKGASIAATPEGAIIGVFSTRREAFRAISEQQRTA
jgi:porphobilinogen deaminase